MSTRKTQVPAVPTLLPSDPNSVKRAHDAIKEILEVAHGIRGDQLDRFVTLRELSEAGIGRVSGSGALVGAGGGGGGAGVFDPGPPDFGDTDFTVPPAPTGVTARGVGADGMFITWNQPGYRNHAYAEVFSWPVPNANRPAPDVPINFPSTPLAALQAAAPSFIWTRPVSTNNAHPRHVGNSIGAVLMQRGILREEDANPPLENAIDNQLFPRAFRYFVRFVSTAGVPGPLAPVPQGATGVMTINPTDLLDAMVRSVQGTQVYQELRRMISLANLTAAEQAELAAQGSLTRFALSRDAALRQQIVQLTGPLPGEPGGWQLTNETLSSVSLRNRSTLGNLWTVRMNQSVGGVTYAAGFGLGIETNLENGRSLSTFAISANQFVVSGPTTPFLRVVALTALQSGILQLTVASPIPSGTTTTKFAISAVDVADSQDPDFINARNMSGLEGDAFYSVGSQTVVLSRAGGWGVLPGLQFNEEQCRKVGLAIVGPQSIPFIIDTQRGVVGVRGSLIVDGLVRSQIGDFDQLLADSAFINHLRAQTVNANVVIGQRIIAGMPPQPLTGQVGNGDIANFSNYLLELNNPLVGSPLRYYRPGGPQGPHVAAELDQAGNFRIGGNLEVGRNAVVNTTDSTHLLSIGGVGADTPDDSYALWIGPRGTYGADGGGRRESDALMFVRTNGRVGIKADLFLGGDPLTVPTSTGRITVRPLRDNPDGLARVFLSAQVSIAPTIELRGCVYDVFFGLIGVNHVGRGLGTLRDGIGYWAINDFGPVGGAEAAALLANHVELVNPAAGNFSQPPMAATAAWIQVDARTGSQDLKNINVQGSVVIAPGDYKVFVSIITKAVGNTDPHGVYAGSFFAMQTQR